MTTPRTKADAYRQLVDSGDDVALRKRVCAALAVEPSTTAELAARFPDRSSNAVQPRVTELMQMGCVTRLGTRENPSGASAYVHHVTARGEQFLADEIDPDPGEPVSQRASDVVATARAVLLGEADHDDLFEAVESHDDLKERMKPDFESRLVATDGGEPIQQADPQRAIRYMHDTDEQFFARYVGNTESVGLLRQYNAYEAEREARRERIKTVNQRIAALQADE